MSYLDVGNKFVIDESIKQIEHPQYAIEYPIELQLRLEELPFVDHLNRDVSLIFFVELQNLEEEGRTEEQEPCLPYLLEVALTYPEVSQLTVCVL